MNDQVSDKVEEPHFPGEIELYGDPGIASFDAPVATFLILVYIMMPIWGIIAFYYFSNGSWGWLDRGYWRELQIAANTTFPIQNQNMPPQQDQSQNSHSKANIVTHIKQK